MEISANQRKKSNSYINMIENMEYVFFLSEEYLENLLEGFYIRNNLQ